ncbi:MAG: hypothetical protein LC630_00345 [Bacteroidales bacterium]|nr:hypothetical protein [Bacteroidales bacterium]
MKFLKQNWLIITILALVIALVLIRSFSRDSFRYDAVRWAASSADGSNLISTDQMVQAGEQVLLISLGTTAEVPAQVEERSVMIPPGLILEKENMRMIRRNKGPVILWSDDASVSARVWMVLSEMGIKDLYILSDKGAETP